MACLYLLNSRGGPQSFDFVITTYSYPLLGADLVKTFEENKIQTEKFT